ncbi:MAG: type VI secretion system tube protein Hcp [Clostridia bacterium]|nr:type VI secretion system tube protein Hcp [Clostridia bacterium]
MKKRVILLMILVTGLILSFCAAEGEGVFLRLDGVEGDASEGAHARWIEVISFSMQTTRDSSITMTFRHPEDRGAARLAEEKGFWSGSGVLEVCVKAFGKDSALQRAELTNIQVVKTENVYDGGSMQDVTVRIEKVEWSFPSGAPDGRGGLQEVVLNLDGIGGDSVVEKHAGWIDVLSFTAGNDVNAQVTGGEMTFRHPVDSATPLLQAACMNGTIIGNGTLDTVVVKNGAKIVASSGTYGRMKVMGTEVHMAQLANGKTAAVEEVTLLYNSEKWSVANAPDAPAPSGSGHYFLQLDSVKGGCGEERYNGYIDVLSFTKVWETEPVLRYVRPGKGKLTFVHEVDSATPTLREYGDSSTGINAGKLYVVENIDGALTEKYKDMLDDLRVTGTKIYAEEDPRRRGIVRLLEEVTLEFGNDSWSSLVKADPRPDGSNIYMRLDGVEGESQDGKHANWIDVEEFSTDDKTKTVDIIRRSDRATAGLLQYCRKAPWIGSGRIEVCGRVGGQKIVVAALDMTDIRIYREAVTGEMTYGSEPVIKEEVGLVCEAMNLETDPSKLNPPQPVPPTGDDMPLVLYLLLLSAAAAVCGVMVKARRY